MLWRWRCPSRCTTACWLPPPKRTRHSAVAHCNARATAASQQAGWPLGAVHSMCHIDSRGKARRPLRRRANHGQRSCSPLQMASALSILCGQRMCALHKHCCRAAVPSPHLRRASPMPPMPGTPTRPTPAECAGKRVSSSQPAAIKCQAGKPGSMPCACGTCQTGRANLCHQHRSVHLCWGSLQH
jgi:hypothetical protein